MKDILLVTLLLPVIYLMQMIKMKTKMIIKYLYSTDFISTVGGTVSSTGLSF